MAIRHTKIRAGEFTFDALAAGPSDGELVLLLHGFPQSAEEWRGALQTLGDAGFRAVAPNQRGYSAGARPEGVTAYRMSELTDDVLAIARELGRERFHLIGHDWGGTVAWSLAGESPDAVASLTVFTTPHTAALGKALRSPNQRARMAYIPLLRTPVVAETLMRAGGGALLESLLTMTGLSRAHAKRDVRILLALGPSGPLNWYRAIGGASLPPDARVEVPTMYIWGDRDVAFGREAAEDTEEYVTGPYHFVELTGASHWIPDEHWDDVEDLVLDHLREHPVGRTRALT